MASAARSGRWLAGTIGILAAAALVGVPASSAAANPLCLDLLAIELCLGAPEEAPAPAPTQPDPQPTEPEPSTPPATPTEPQEPADEPAPARPSAPVTTDAPSGTPSTAPASTSGSAAVTSPSSAPVPVPTSVPSPTPTPRPSSTPDAGSAPVVFIEAGPGAAPGTAPLFAAGVMLFGAGALGAAGLAMARHRTDAEPGAAEHAAPDEGGR